MRVACGYPAAGPTAPVVVRPLPGTQAQGMLERCLPPQVNLACTTQRRGLRFTPCMHYHVLVTPSFETLCYLARQVTTYPEAQSAVQAPQ